MNKLQQLIERDQWSELLVDAQDLYKQSKNSEIEIFAFSDKEAIKKAENIFNITREHLQYKCIYKGKSSFFNFIKEASAYIFSVKEEAKHLFNSTIEYDKNNELAQNKDGTIRLLMKKSGLELLISPPIGLGQQVTKDQILQEIQKQGFNTPHDSLIDKALKTEKPVIVSPYVKSQGQDSIFYITISKDYMEASMVFTQPQDNGCIPDVADIIKELQNQGVNFGINNKYIEEALNNKLYNIPVVIAQGTPSKNGRNAYIEYTFPTGEEIFKHAMRSDGSVNFKELNIIHNVHKHDVLAIMHPETLGIPGHTIKGTELPARNGESIAWNIGSNVILSSNKLEALAASTGQVYLKNKQICVDPALEIASDVDLSIGNIDFLGNVIIKGSIVDGFSVISGGNIEVHGHIGNCFMHAEGDIVAHQGIQGKDNARIECKGNLFAHFIERTSVDVGENLIITKAILHSKVLCHKGVYITGNKKAIIAGGDIKALNEIVSTQIGAESYIETRIEVGYSKTLIDKISQLKKTIESIQNQISELSMQLSMLSPDSPKANNIHLDISQLQKQEIKKTENLEKTQTQLKYIRQNSSISASGSFLPGVKIKIGAQHLDINSEQISGSIKLNNTKDIVFGSYAPSKFMQELVQKNKK